MPPIPAASASLARTATWSTESWACPGMDSIGLLTQSWKPKANVELVQKLRLLLKRFTSVRFVKVAAHTGIPLNERVDQLASSAISRGR